ncbi:MAG TPA: cytochrome c oxidase subunit II [Burkholderiaceae bacterium]|nr:cytochrome c oxidase subunit II [Burkholderiaceae bacterium]
MTDAASPSVLSPASLEAAVLGELIIVMTVGAVIVFALTMGALAWSLRRGPKPEVSTRWWVLGAGIAFPAVVLTALLAYGTLRTVGLERGLKDPALVVGVIGRLWWWELRYRDPVSGREVVSANELRIPVGRRVQLGLMSDDVVHSFWVPQLGGKMDLVPGRVNRLVITAQQPGLYRGQCAEFCGTQHTKMALHVLAMPADAFDEWLAAQTASQADTRAGRQATDTPTTDPPGRQAFVANGCSACHAVDAAPGGPRLAPTLAQVASRAYLGAGVLPNEAGALRRWLGDIQALKPGARMPSYAHLDAATLDSLAEYLETLR